MKKIIMTLALIATLALSTTVFAAVNVNSTDNTAVQSNIVNEETAKENYLTRMELEKDYVKSLYDKGLITKEQYNFSTSNIQANIDYVTENGLSVPNAGIGYYSGHHGMGHGGYGGHHFGHGW